MKKLIKKISSVLSLILIGSALAFQINAACGFISDGKPGTCTWGDEGLYCETEVVPFENCSA